MAGLAEVEPNIFRLNVQYIKSLPSCDCLAIRFQLKLYNFKLNYYVFFLFFLQACTQEYGAQRVKYK